MDSRSFLLKATLAWIFALCVPVPCDAATNSFELISARATALGRRNASGDSTAPTLSRDGRWLCFLSTANNLVTNDHNNAIDLFVRDLQTGRTVMVSRNQDGTSGGNANSTAGAVSDNGRFVAFASDASDLVSNDTNGTTDVFVRDLQTGTTALVSAGFGGIRSGNGPSTAPVISSDGQSVLFESAASDLVPDDTNGIPDLFLRDLRTGTTQRVTAGAIAAIPGYGSSGSAVMTPDARFMAFSSTAVQLVPGLTNVWGEVLLHEADSGTTAWISHEVAPAHPYRLAGSPALSDDGQVIAFKVVTDTQPVTSILYEDFRSGQTAVISTNATRLDPDIVDWSGPVLSPDGRFVAFEQEAAGQLGIWLWDGRTLKSTLVSAGQSPTGTTAPPLSRSPLLSADGTRVAFLSIATNLTSDRVSGGFQLFLQDVTNGTTRLLSQAPGHGEVADVVAPCMNGDGSVIAFQARDSEGSSTGGIGHYAVFVWRAAANDLELASEPLPDIPAVTGDAGSSIDWTSVSADGRWIAFTSDADDLVEMDQNEVTDVFVRDRRAGTNLLVSVRADGTGSGSGVSRNPVLSPNGRWVVFTSRSGDLSETPDNNGRDDVYVRDLELKRTVLVSANPDGVSSATGDSTAGTISDDGRFVAFESWATDLVVGVADANHRRDVFVRDLLENRTILVSTGTTTNVTADGESGNALISPNGRYVLYRTTATIFSAGVPSRGWRLFDLQARTTQPLSDYPMVFAGAVQSVAQFSADSNWLAFQDYAALGTVAQGIYLSELATRQIRLVCTNCSSPSLSADGALLAYESAPPRNPQHDVWCYDRRHNSTMLVSVKLSPDGTGSSRAPMISPNGRYVFFESDATNLVAEPTPGLRNLFARDLLTAQTVCLTPSAAQTGPSTALSVRARPSGDGERIAFMSFASDWSRADLNQTSDVFLASLVHSDTDGDGLPDDWETAYFGNLTHDGSADTDGDGVTDLEEFRAGTNPVDPGSVFRLVAVTVGAEGIVELGWSSAPGKAYQVQTRPVLEEGTWKNVADPVVASSFHQTRALASASGGQAYYRVVITEP